ncbi:CNH domain-containing protein [Boletus edulis]|uniref:CNH domain-containing protein n=1 Tax=Boletus edulis BED1 TaxID=1328754 RepID=A0AAD4C5C9_BOLED|nr:CNH domain-containing protein [Boletus edulis]KAF8448840.1 CNH domain-containing protein [Boletus edulis BED1]
MSSRVIQPQHSPTTDFINRRSLIRAPGPPLLTQLRSQDADVGLGRATSTGSTISSAQTDLLGRNTSATTTATTYSDHNASKGGASVLARDNSVGSYPFPVAGPSTVGYPKTHDDPANGYTIHGGSIESFDRSRPGDYAAAGGSGGVLVEEDEADEYFTDSDDPDPDRFVNFSLLSHLAVRLRDKVPRGTHVKSSIPYPRAFTGKDIVSTIQSQIQRELLINHGVSTADRRAALQVARSLQSQLFFYEVEWGDKPLQDGVEDVYMFLDDLEGNSESQREREELPTAVITMLTKCYTSTCSEESPCYSWVCPRRRAALVTDITSISEPDPTPHAEDWLNTVDPSILRSLPESEIHRQTIIHKTISQEEQYVQDLDSVEALFIRPLRRATHIMPASQLDDFIEEVFSNILDLRECNKRLVEAMYVRQREQSPIISKIGDVFLEAARSFRYAYPAYVARLPFAEKRFKEEIEANANLRLFLEECSRQSARQQEPRRLDLKHFLSRPSEHLQKYPIALEAIMKETTEGNPDAYYLAEAIHAIKDLQNIAQLRTFQIAMCKGPTAKWEWHDLVPSEAREGLSKSEAKRQAIIFELIKGEMGYVKDMENIEMMYVQPLRTQDPPIIPRERMENFITDVFHNFTGIYGHHRKLLDQLHEIQREEHPTIKSITAAIFDAALSFRDAYMEYIPNYPIAAYRIDDEMATNFEFKTFVDQCTRHPDAHRLDMKNFIYRPIPRLLRYQLLLKGILEETPAGHEDREAIPQVLEIIKSLGKDSEPGVESAKQKVQLWCYNSNIVFKPGESVDMDLLNVNRSLVHAGKLLRQPETGFEWNGWTELFVLLFDNYLVLTKTKEKDGVTKYYVNRRPIPLDLLNLTSFLDPPTQRSTGILRLGLGNRHGDSAAPATPGSGMPDSATDSRLVYPCTIHYSGRLGGLYTLFTESPQARVEWKQKLEEAIGLRKVVQESNKVFEMEPLSTDTFFVPAISASATTPSWNHENSFTGKVTCSVPFTTTDGRPLVAIGCAEGVWIGFRHDSRSMRRVLHLKMVTQCAMLEDFGMFLVLADKALFAYHIEALVPSSPQSAHTSQTPQRVNGTRDVHFFSVGNQGGRTLVIYMKKKGLDSVFRVLEPVVEKINERSKAPASFTSRFGIRPARSEWFRLYREFFLPSESFDLVFLKAKISILCTKGFEIMDLTDFKSVTIPLRDDGHERLAKRCESCKPMGMFRVENEFLLCYDEFGIYVNKHGAPSRSSSTIEWEGTAERVAMHWPYILLFDSRFIEVRHISSGLLAQIIPGNEIRCIWDGRGTSSTVATVEGLQQPMILDPHIHAVMSAPEPLGQPVQPGRSRAIAQHVFELVPTVPLYPPGSLASPSQSAYFQQSSSPPHSPSVVANSWN